MKKIIKAIKLFINTLNKKFYIDDETKDALQNLELKEDGYLYLGTE